MNTWTYIWTHFKEDLKPGITNPGKRRYASLDMIKIFAAFLVVFYHYSFYTLDYGFAEGVPYLPNITRIIMSIAACSVPLFFMVNGALMFSRKRDWRDVYYKAAKIVILTICFSLLGFPKWFFQTLAVLYLLYPVFYWLWEKRRPVYYLIIALLLIFPFFYNEGTVILKLFSDRDYAITGAKTMYSIVYFLLGNVLFRKKAFPRWLSIILLLGGMGLLLFDCVVLTNYHQKLADGVNGAFPTLGALLLAVGVFELMKSIELECPSWLSFFSQGVLPIYLLHVFVINTIMSLFGEPTVIVFALLGSVLICLLCCGIGWLLKKVPVLCFFFRI